MILTDTECDLEELTALLDEEDEGDNDEFKGDSVTFDNDDAKGPDKEINDRDEAGEASESDTGKYFSWEKFVGKTTGKMFLKQQKVSFLHKIMIIWF